MNKKIFSFLIAAGVLVSFPQVSFAKGFYSTGPFNQIIPSGAHYSRIGPIGSIRSVQENYSVPIYRVNSNVALVKVFNDYGRAVYWPIPHSAIPSSGSDHTLVVIDERKGMVYEMWNARWSGNSIHAGNMKDFPLGGDGISHPSNQRVTASGFALTAGAVAREDINRGNISHALIVSLPHNALARNSFIAPAVNGESHTDNVGSIPVGAKLALSRNISLSGMKISPTTRMIINAMQNYGAIVSDRNNAQSYKGKYVATFQVEKGLMSNSLSAQTQNEMYEVIQKYGLFRVN